MCDTWKTFLLTKFRLSSGIYDTILLRYDHAQASFKINKNPNAVIAIAFPQDHRLIHAVSPKYCEKLNLAPSVLVKVCDAVPWGE